MSVDPPKSIHFQHTKRAVLKKPKLQDTVFFFPLSSPRQMWADPDMGAILTIKGLVRGGTFWLLFLAVEKK